MNANQIHIGHEYAICPYAKPNGNAFIPGAIRFKAFRTFGEQEWGNKRLTMYVEGFRLDTETGDIVSTNYVKYRVRDVIEDWDEYEDRKDQHEVEQEKIRAKRREQEEQWRREAEERNKLRQQQEDEKQRRIESLKQKILERGLPSPTIDQYTNRVSFNLVDLEAWLNSLQKVDCLTCGRSLLQIPVGVI